MQPTTLNHTRLLDLRAGERGLVISLGSGKQLISRLTALGFTPGGELVVNQNYAHGPLIVTVRGGRVAIGRGEAAAILVERRDE